MLEYAQGDTKSFEFLYARHKGPLYRYFLRQVREKGLAEELLQDVWMNIVRTRTHYEVRAKFTTYLYRLAHNRLIDHYRRHKNRLPISYDDEPDDPIMDKVAAGEGDEPPNRHERAALADRLLKALETLPEAQREAFLLREEAGLSLEEIAEAMQVNRETAKSRLRYAVTKLRESLTGVN
jgi:RNA polymerase sigma-70 factor (ECF subfamily)